MSARYHSNHMSQSGLDELRCNVSGSSTAEAAWRGMAWLDRRSLEIGCRAHWEPDGTGEPLDIGPLVDDEARDINSTSSQASKTVAGCLDTSELDVDLQRRWARWARQLNLALVGRGFRGSEYCL